MCRLLLCHDLLNVVRIQLRIFNFFLVWFVNWKKFNFDVIVELREGTPNKNENVGPLPCPRQRVDFVWILYKYRLNRQSRIKRSRLELYQARSIAACSFRKNQDLRPIFSGLHSIQNILDGLCTRVVIFTAKNKFQLKSENYC